MQATIEVSGRPERRVPWPVSWSGVWVGALAALAAMLLFGLAGLALGAHQVRTGQEPIVGVGEVGLGALVFGVLGTFLSFALGGWVAGKIGGFLLSEPAMLHGAIVWLVALPILLVLVAIGAGGFFGSWIGGLAGTPAWTTPPPTALGTDAATAARNAALGSATALLIGLMGSVVGGWMASGEPMTFTRRRTDEAAAVPHASRAGSAG